MSIALIYQDKQNFKRFIHFLFIKKFTEPIIRDRKQMKTFLKHRLFLECTKFPCSTLPDSILSKSSCCNFNGIAKQTISLDILERRWKFRRFCIPNWYFERSSVISSKYAAKIEKSLKNKLGNRRKQSKQCSNKDTINKPHILMKIDNVSAWFQRVISFGTSR